MPEEIQLARHAGDVAVAMLKGAVETAGVGVSEYEIALAVQNAGTRKAAELLETHYNEMPQLAMGDKTELVPGMVFAVDGAVDDPGVSRAQTGDSIVVTDNGYETLTNYSNNIDDLIIKSPGRFYGTRLCRSDYINNHGLIE